MDSSLINPGHWTRDFLETQGVDEALIGGITISVDFIVLVLASLLADFVARSILLKIIQRWVIRTAATWDDHFFKRKSLSRIGSPFANPLNSGLCPNGF